MLIKEITKDADKLLCLIYNDYLNDRADGKPKSIARYTGSSEEIFKRHLFSTLEDIDETCRELNRAGFLECLYADNMVCDTCLTDEAIVYMENRFPNRLKNVAEIWKELGIS